jgi:hypothetical protein
MPTCHILRLYACRLHVQVTSSRHDAIYYDRDAEWRVLEEVCSNK